MIGLGLGLHEPLRTKMIEEGYEHLRAALAAHDAQVKAEALREAADAAYTARVGSLLPGIIGIAWLRARADRLSGGGSDA